MSWQDDLRDKRRKQERKKQEERNAEEAKAKAEEERKTAIRAKAQKFWDELVAQNDSLDPELRLEYNANGTIQSNPGLKGSRKFHGPCLGRKMELMLRSDAQALIVCGSVRFLRGNHSYGNTVAFEVHFSVDSETGALKLGNTGIPAMEVPSKSMNADVIIKRLCEYNLLDSMHTSNDLAKKLFAPESMKPTQVTIAATGSAAKEVPVWIKRSRAVGRLYARNCGIVGGIIGLIYAMYSGYDSAIILGAGIGILFGYGLGRLQ